MVFETQERTSPMRAPAPRKVAAAATARRAAAARAEARRAPELSC
jgi:hypothetical protein